MKILNKEIHLKGFLLTQVWREGDLAIYQQQTKDHETQKVNPDIIGYEIIVIEVKPRTVIKEIIIEEHEAYPKGEDWGLKAWSAMTFEAARMRISRIKERRYEIANLII